MGRGHLLSSCWNGNILFAGLDQKMLEGAMEPKIANPGERLYASIMKKNMKYTLCFIRRGSQFLMLNRKNHPCMGLWNGVGGKIEQDEHAEDSVIREILEETSIVIKEVTFKGIVTWNTENGNKEGMCVYFADVPDSLEYHTPYVTEEGILDWKEIDWVLDERNYGSLITTKHFLPAMLNEETLYVHHCEFQNDQLIEYRKTPLVLTEYSSYILQTTGR